MARWSVGEKGGEADYGDFVEKCGERVGADYLVLALKTNNMGPGSLIFELDFAEGEVVRAVQRYRVRDQFQNVVWAFHRLRDDRFRIAEDGSHYLIYDFADIRLTRARDGELVATGEKQWHCFTDVCPVDNIEPLSSEGACSFDQNDPSAPMVDAFLRGVNQQLCLTAVPEHGLHQRTFGISPCWADVYWHTLCDQRIALPPGLEPGDYICTVTTNTPQLFLERAGGASNTTQVMFRINMDADLPEDRVVGSVFA